MSDEPPPTVQKSAAPLAALSFGSLATALGLGVIQIIDPKDAEKLPDIMGTIPGWIGTGGIMGLLALAIFYLLNSRKIGVDEKRVGIERETQQDKDKADIRDHYAAEVASLRDRIDKQAERHGVNVAAIEARYKKMLDDAEDRYRKSIEEVEAHYRRALVDADKRHDDCVKDRDALREEVAGLKSEIDGLRRQFAAAGADRVIALGEPGHRPPSDAVVESAHRVKGVHVGGRVAGGRQADRGLI